MTHLSSHHVCQIALYELVAMIPEGKVTSYGQLAGCMPVRIPALTIGRWMAFCPPDLPWWRVVGANGTLLIAKRSPEFARQQAERLRSEGVPFLEPGQVDIEQCRWVPDDGSVERLYLLGE